MRRRDAASDKVLAGVFTARQQRDAEFLVGALRDPANRGLAARFLADIGHSEAIPGISLLLDASDPGVRVAAVKSLGRLRSVGSLPRIARLASSDPHPQVRLWSIAALGEIGEHSSFPLLSELLAAPAWDTRRAAAFALGLLGDERAIEGLREAARTERLDRRGVYRRAIRTIKSHSGAI